MPDLQLHPIDALLAEAHQPCPDLHLHGIARGRNSLGTQTCWVCHGTDKVLSPQGKKLLTFLTDNLSVRVYSAPSSDGVLELK